MLPKVYWDFLLFKIGKFGFLSVDKSSINSLKEQVLTDFECSDSENIIYFINYKKKNEKMTKNFINTNITEVIFKNQILYVFYSLLKLNLTSKVLENFLIHV